jgi:hypothetical protein
MSVMHQNDHELPRLAELERLWEDHCRGAQAICDLLERRRAQGTSPLRVLPGGEEPSPRRRPALTVVAK